MKKSGRKARTKDLAVKGKTARRIKGGVTKSAPLADVVKTPPPGGPVPIPYPN